MNGIYLYFVNKHLSSWALLGLSQTTHCLGWAKLKVCADDKIEETEKLKFIWGKVENVVGKGEMLVNSIFSFSHIVFSRSLKLGIV